MRILDTDATLSELEGIVHRKTQEARPGLDLTAGAVARVVGAGRLDFGGSEFEEAGRETLAPERADPDDDYGWWELTPGTFAVRYNESLALGPDRVAAVLPLPRLLRAGASHPGFVVAAGDGPLEALLTVGTGGCALKENCRISRLVVAQPG